MAERAAERVAATIDRFNMEWGRGEAAGNGMTEPVRARADAALLRALVATEADLVLVRPGEVALDNGVGAVLRYVDVATRHR